MTFKSIAGTALLTLFVAMPHSYSFAQAFPTKPVRIVVPQTPGGASDALAAEPADNPLGVEDYITTVYHLLGIDAAKSLMSPGDRPQPIVTNGKVVQGLLA